jgi:GNAT superfamily N-acetyltransferase
MHLVPLTGQEDRARLLAIALQDMSAGYREALEDELEGIAGGTHRGVWAVGRMAPAGYAVYHRTVQTHHLDTIAVDRSWRGMGIGRALLDWICADLRRTGPSVLNVVTDASARETLRFYLDRGFVLAGRVRDEFLPGVTQAHLTLEIP